AGGRCPRRRPRVGFRYPALPDAAAAARTLIRPTPNRSTAMPGTMIEFKANGRTAQGYLARPTSPRGHGLLVIQEYWGLVDHIKDLADRFAAEGFFALAPDLYHGEQAKSPDDAGKLMMALNIAETAKDLRGAADTLIAVEGVSPKQVGIVGFCMG